MNQRLPIYFEREPRVDLYLEDDRSLRLKTDEFDVWDSELKTRNVSITGISFEAPLKLLLVPGDMIRLQFQLPDKTQVALFAEIVWIRDENGKQLIGAEFSSIHEKQQLALQNHLFPAPSRWKLLWYWFRSWWSKPEVL